MTVTAVPCDRDGCSGTVVDGYCDTCGMAPRAGARPASSAESAPAPTGGTPSAGGATAATAPPSARTGQRGTGRVSGRVDVSRLTGRTTASGRTGTTSGTTRRSRIGAGLVEIEPMPTVDPAEVVMADPSVPEHRRWCTRCDSPVGRSQGDRPGRTSGFCSNCGARFDFTAKLRTGDLVAGQYEVAGALAHGGMGWIYLARDRNVSGRWCVLKGLLDTADPDAAVAAVAERRFLAEVRHPNIVGIHNFVQHEGQGYIVMEYVGGPSLKQLATRRREAGEGPMPVTEAAARPGRAPPSGTCTTTGWSTATSSPTTSSTRATGDVIDLGGVRRVDDHESAIFGTIGYQAPEVPTPGRRSPATSTPWGALAVLILDWPEWSSSDVDRLPPGDHEVLVEHDCLWRFLQRACAPTRRTASRRRRDGRRAPRRARPGGGLEDGRPRPRTSALQPAPTPPRRAVVAALPSLLLPNHPRLPTRWRASPRATPRQSPPCRRRPGAELGRPRDRRPSPVRARRRRRRPRGDRAARPRAQEAAEHRAVIGNVRSYCGVAALAAATPPAPSASSTTPTRPPPASRVRWRSPSR